MTQVSPRTGSIYCLIVWAAIWFVWMVMRFSPLDIRVIPGIGTVMLASLVTALLAPLVATVLALAALIRGPRTALTWLVLAASVAVTLGQGFVFVAMSWM